MNPDLSAERRRLLEEHKKEREKIKEHTAGSKLTHDRTIPQNERRRRKVEMERS